MRKGNGKLLLVAFIVILVTAAVFLEFAWNHTDIPKLYLEGDISGMEDKRDVRDVAFTYMDGQQKLEGFAKIKIQGKSSVLYEKKNFTIKLYTDSAHEEKLPIDVGWGEQNKYCLKANWIDRTHSRNIVSMNLAAEMQAQYDLMTDTPTNGTVDGFPIEIYSNGDFYGLYTLNIPKDHWLFGMDKDNPNHIVLGGEMWEPTNFFLAMPDFGAWPVEVGQESEETFEKVNRLFHFIMNSSDAEFKSNFDQYLNLDSVLNYYIFADFAHLQDNFGKNILLVTYDGLRWHVCLYDLDTSWGATYNGRSLYPYEEEMVPLAKNRLFERMEQCFPKELSQRYFELRETVLYKEHIMEAFYGFREQIPELTFLKEAIKWGNGPIRQTADLPGYDYEQIESYLDTVTWRLDEKYQSMLQ